MKEKTIVSIQYCVLDHLKNGSCGNSENLKISSAFYVQVRFRLDNQVHGSIQYKPYSDCSQWNLGVGSYIFAIWAS